MAPFVELGEELGPKQGKGVEADADDDKGYGDGRLLVPPVEHEPSHHHSGEKMYEGVVLFVDVLSQQDIDQHRHEGKCGDQGAQQGEAEGIGQGGEEFAFYLLEGEDGHEAGDDDQLGEEDRFSELGAVLFDQAHFGHLVESFHADIAGLVVEDDKKPFHHDHGAVDDDPEVYCAQ